MNKIQSNGKIISMKLKVRDLVSNPNCVLLHGWGVNSGVFTHLCDELSPALRIRLIDLPGFGCNNHIDIGARSFEQIAELLLHALPKKSVIVGWSLGGLFAQQLALLAPERFLALVQICSTPKFVANDSWGGIKPAVLQQFQAQLKLDHVKTIERFLAIQAMGSDSARNDIKQIRDLVAENGAPHANALAQGLEFLNSIDLRDALMNSQVPTLRVYGAKDSLVPTNNLEEMDRLCPNSKKLTIRGASHAPFISHKKDFTHVLVNYLSELGVDIP